MESRQVLALFNIIPRFNTTDPSHNNIIKKFDVYCFSFSSIGPVADLMSASSSYLDKNHCYNSHVYSQNYGSPHCYYGNMDYLSSGVPHPSLNVPVSFKQIDVET